MSQLPRCFFLIRCWPELQQEHQFVPVYRPPSVSGCHSECKQLLQAETEGLTCKRSHSARLCLPCKPYSQHERGKSCQIPYNIGLWVMRDKQMKTARRNCVAVNRNKLTKSKNLRCSARIPSARASPAAGWPRVLSSSHVIWTSRCKRFIHSVPH